MVDSHFYDEEEDSLPLPQLTFGLDEQHKSEEGDNEEIN